LDSALKERDTALLQLKETQQLLEGVRYELKETQGSFFSDKNFSSHI
jgi:hypothetical protein